MDESRQCTGKSKQSQERCKRAAIVDGHVCAIHGGKAPQVKRVAAERLAALVDPAITALEDLLDSDIAPQTRLAAAKDVLDRNGFKPAEKVDATLQVDDVTGLSETDRTTRILAIVQRARERADRALGSAESDLDATTGATD